MAEPRAWILLVDDEPPLLKLMQLFLERMGYQVTSCLDATSALEKLEAQPEGFHLVVADLSLPDMPGDKMALRMIDSNPELKVLLCSGYPFEVSALPPERRASFGVLQKPFLPNMLTKAVEDLLKRKA
jgi:DNA-binding NtrC family response regulator